MNAQFEGSRPYPTRMGFEMPDFADQETITKWVIVPGATIAALFIMKRMFRRRRRRNGNGGKR